MFLDLEVAFCAIMLHYSVYLELAAMSDRKNTPIARTKDLNPPTKGEHDFLMLVYEYFLLNNNTYPDDSWIQFRMKFATLSGVSNHKRNLKRKGYLSVRHKSINLSSNGWNYCLESSPFVSPLKIKLLGEVRAGKIMDNVPDAVIENWNEETDDVEVLNIPNENQLSGIFALKVIGQSLEHEGIFSDDYVLVQRFVGGQGPTEGQLIITYYVPIEVAREANESGTTDAFLVGPVVKYFYRDTETIYLGWRKDRRQAPDHYRIRAATIRPVGRVVGLYRHLP